MNRKTGDNPFLCAHWQQETTDRANDPVIGFHRDFDCGNPCFPGKPGRWLFHFLSGVHNNSCFSGNISPVLGESCLSPRTALCAFMMMGYCCAGSYLSGKCIMYAAANGSTCKKPREYRKRYNRRSSGASGYRIGSRKFLKNADQRFRPAVSIALPAGFPLLLPAP